ncbi:MAG: hypothetical protein ACLU9X_08190 [Alistipes shahii]
MPLQGDERRIGAVLDMSGGADETRNAGNAARTVHRGGDIQRHGRHIAAVFERSVADAGERRRIDILRNAFRRQFRRGVDRQVADLRTLGHVAEERLRRVPVQDQVPVAGNDAVERTLGRTDGRPRDILHVDVAQHLDGPAVFARRPVGNVAPRR